MTTVSDLDLDISPVPRSREENQERAFIAASRRKDRSLDARLESANRASMLHKKRTGKALHITKEIVEKEAMYEEVDERYQEKRIRMLQAQNLQIEEEFQRHLLAAFAARANGSSSALASRRAASIGGPRKMSLDLSGLNAACSSQNCPPSLTSPMVHDSGYGLSPAGSPFAAATPVTAVACHSPHSAAGPMGPSAAASPYHHPHGLSTVTPGPLPQYIAGPQQPLTPSWPQRSPVQPTFRSWQGFAAPADCPPSVEMWQQRLVQQSHLPSPEASTFRMRPFRDRLASAPELPVYPTTTTTAMPTLASATATATAAAAAAAAARNPMVHTRAPSDPIAAPNFSESSSPQHLDLVSTETLSTPELCPTPNTPLSPTSGQIQYQQQQQQQHDNTFPVSNSTSSLDLDLFVEKEGENLMVSSHDDLDPEFDEFSRFAWGLGQGQQLLLGDHHHHHHQLGQLGQLSTLPPPARTDTFGFDDIVFDEFATSVA
ncbi:hypothetical protein ASPZODRAFT_165661 [Penicilliopsis zonata CBS 506.65]|uniref:Uncharacterized protein n=1 Tax=Penicilliopsis zonata CBS 506.65 TaxID=1073090 RepID=A0A1L9SK95_9EURO|nr:hypothetical protein ASPZODRAFT_165661 [Penicilliopsis zonata CBS 506.65]OJJ47516.1 hypothetical protein ASPZODRAFT_165661 [Penicilliopsis zonata CBS 506.65]